MSNSHQAQAQRIVSPVLAYVTQNEALGMYATLTYSNGVLVSCIGQTPVNVLMNKLRGSGDPDYQNLEVMSLDAYMVKKEEFDAGVFNVGIPTPITESRFNEMLNILPPEKWEFDKNQGTEAFRISEPTSGDLHSFYVRIGKNHFEVVHHRFTDYAVLFKACELVIQNADLSQAKAV